MIRKFRNHEPQIAEDAFVFDSAEIIGQVSLGKQVSIWANAVLRGDIGSITIGEYSNIQDNCCVHITEGLPVVVGKRVTVGHGAILHSCYVGDNCLIGMGAILLDKSCIGEGSVVGAGSLVPPGKKFPPNSLIVGSPARVVRTLTPGNQEDMKKNVANYTSIAQEYRKDGSF